MPDPFASIIGHEAVLDVLRRTLESPAPAYLFHGPEGVGKRAAAQALAASFLKLEAGRPLDAHPDFIRLQREEGTKAISVDRARELIARMGMSSAMGGRKVALIEEAGTLNDSSTNALLKAVEEPTPGAVYIFVAEEPTRLPATLRSRLTPLIFARVPESAIARWLEKRGVSSSAAKAAADASRGCPGIALRIAQDPEAWQARLSGIHALLSTLARDNLGSQVAALERLAKACDSTSDPEGEWRMTLALLMQASADLLARDPQAGMRIGEGLARAWRFVGTSLSPRLALEWSAVQPYLKGDIPAPSILTSSYL